MSSGKDHVKSSFEALSYKKHLLEDDEETSQMTSPTGMIKNFDDLLQHIGEFGLFQVLVMLVLAYSTFIANVIYLSQQFMVLTPKHYWCHIPELQYMTPEDRLRLAVPLKSERKGSNEFRYENCLMFDLNYTEVASGMLINRTSTPIVGCQHGIEYNFTGYYPTITTEYDWVCENDWKPNFAQSVFFVGSAIGTVIFSFISDRFGRRMAFITSTIWAAVFGVASAFSWDLTSFSVFRTLVGFSYQQAFASILVLAVEYVGVKYRTLVIYIPVVFISGPFSACLPWIAFGLNDWRKYTFILHAPFFLCLVVPLIIPDSARWKISRGKVQEVIKDSRFVASVNRKKVDLDIFRQFQLSVEKRKYEEPVKTHSTWDLIVTPNVRKILVIMCFVWGIQAVAYDVVVRNTDNLGINPYISYTLSSLTEAPAAIISIFVLEYLGRRWSSFFSLMLTTIMFMVSLPFIENNPVVNTCLAVIARFFLSISFKTIFQVQTEVYPTVVRSQGMGFTEVFGHFVTLLAPFLIYLGKSHALWPPLILATLCFIIAVAILFVPETLNERLPETLEDGKVFGNDQSFFDFPPTKRSPSYNKLSSLN